MIPSVFRRDHRGRFISNREAFNAYETSLRMAPARDAMHQLRRELSRLARVSDIGGPDNPDRPSGFQAITVFGKRVPDEMPPEEALARLGGHRVAA